MENHRHASFSSLLTMPYCDNTFYLATIMLACLSDSFPTFRGSDRFFLLYVAQIYFHFLCLESHFFRQQSSTRRRAVGRYCCTYGYLRSGRQRLQLRIPLFVHTSHFPSAARTCQFAAHPSVVLLNLTLKTPQQRNGSAESRRIGLRTRLHATNENNIVTF